jgi:hypothetical protein
MAKLKAANRREEACGVISPDSLTFSAAGSETAPAWNAMSMRTDLWIIAASIAAWIAVIALVVIFADKAASAR